MVSIFRRTNKNGSVTWRIQIRRKGLPKAIFSVGSEEGALKMEGNGKALL